GRSPRARAARPPRPRPGPPRATCSSTDDPEPAPADGPESGRPAHGSAPLGQHRRSPRLDLSRGPAPRRRGEPPDARRPAPPVVRCVVTEAGGLVEESGTDRQRERAIFATAPRGPDAGCPGTMARKRGRPPTTLPCRTLVIATLAHGGVIWF